AAEWPHLTDLNLDETGCTAEAANAVVGSPLVPGLLRLGLAKCDLTGESIRALANAGPVRLLSLNLRGNARLGADGLAGLSSPDFLLALCYIDLSYCDLDGKALEKFADTPLAALLGWFPYHGNRTTQTLAQKLNRGYLRLPE